MCGTNYKKGLYRYFKNIKKYPNIVSQNDKTFTSPADLITSNVTSSVQETLSNDVIESYTAELLSILQLWAMKATKEAIQNGLSQLVYASYSAPNDGVFIDAWKNISHGLINSNNPDAIWVVIKHCYRIMKNQVKLTNELLDEKTEKSDREVYTIIVKRLSPLLILRTFPQQAYHYVYLSKPSILKYNVDWDALDINPRSIRWLDEDDHNDPEHLDQSELLFEELSSRAQDPTEFQENQTLAKTLLTHIYCQLS
ncbi:hypothetical protein BDA99DRAFT_58475 [Phascolomyces articulosus]|uniref:Uncharacterized protein n=1 Tax=Phascolomyces articulosus TaxID=60185 RepID=A0AAD5K073_9FUNG|nr:hypothetical protein BDA99DRAFT_58475 [Phascolomyces articulosus]